MCNVHSTKKHDQNIQKVIKKKLDQDISGAKTLTFHVLQYVGLHQ